VIEKQTKSGFWNKRMIIMLLSVGILFGAIFGYQSFKSIMIKKYMSGAGAPVVTVSTMNAAYQMWQPMIKTTGTLRACQGIDVTTEIAGLIRTIDFKPGKTVQTGERLLKMNDDQEVAQLEALIAAAELAKITYTRDKAQFEVKAISQAILDADLADLKSKEAQALAQMASVAKKTIIAPFSGRLGISNVNPGQYLNPGDKIVTLQALDPIYIDFYIPQQKLLQLNLNQSVIIRTDTYPDQTFVGKITTIDPKIDPDTRNVKVEATVSNPETKLLPGMFAEISIRTGAETRHLTLPQTAISFNPYGEIVYIVNQSGTDNKGKPLLTVKQSFITVGETRGDQIAILSGLNEGDMVVTSGQLKLQNGSHITINNSVQPNNDPSPKTLDE